MTTIKDLISEFEKGFIKQRELQGFYAVHPSTFSPKTILLIKELKLNQLQINRLLLLAIKRLDNVSH
jgi:hypothetical protein